MLPAGDQEVLVKLLSAKKLSAPADDRDLPMPV
jgi:hypothetical protein